MLRQFLRIFAIAWLVIATTAITRAAESPGIEFFEAKIRPILVDNCYSCHSSTAKKLKGDIRVDSRESLLKGGASGTASIVPGKLDASNLIHAIRWTDE